MADNEVRARASIQDELSAPLERIAGRFRGLGDHATQASFVGNVAANALTKGMSLVSDAIGMAVDAAGRAVQAYREDQVSVEGLNAALAANIPAWNGSSDAIEKVIASRMRLGFADEQQRDALGILLAATHDQTEALDAQRVAMDLARFRHIDLSTASDMVAKAYEGNVTSLKKLGIVLPQGTKGVEALGAIMKVVGGQAEAFANTDMGKVEAANIRVSESNERVGKAFSKMGTVVMPIVADVAEHVSDFVASGIEGWQMLGAAVGDAVDRMQGKIKVIPESLDTIHWRERLLEGAKGVEDGGHAITAQTQTITWQVGKAWDSTWEEVPLAARKSMADIAKEIVSGRDAVVSAIKGVISDAYDPLIVAAQITATELELADARVAASATGLTKTQKAEADLRVLNLQKHLAELKAEQGQYGTDAQRQAYLIGAATSKQLADGLASGDSARQAQARAAAESIATELYALESKAGVTGRRTGNTFVDKIIEGMEAEQRRLDLAAGNTMDMSDLIADLARMGYTGGAGFTSGAAQGMQDADLSGGTGSISTRLSQFQPSGYSVGVSYVRTLSEGIVDSRYLLGGSLELLGDMMIGMSPPKKGPLRNVDKGGANVGKAWIAGLAKGIADGDAPLDDILSRLSKSSGAGPTAGRGRGFDSGPDGRGDLRPVEVPLILDGREVARIVDRQLYYLARGRTAYTPD